MATSITLIASSTVGAGGTGTISFTSIPSTYTDLCLKLSLRTNSNLATEQLYVTFNGTTSGYTAKQIYGDGSNAASASLTNGGTEISVININTGAGTANTFSSTEIYIPNYAGSNNKSLSADSTSENNGTNGALAGLTAGLLSNTAAITSISFGNQDSATFLQYSTAYLYGVKNA
jgi:hypothetical protein